MNSDANPPNPAQTKSWLVYGQPEPPTPLVPLRAGPLTALFDPATGFIRRIKLGDREVLRGIYAAVRDHNWTTIPVTLRERVRKIEDDAFHIEFEAEHRDGGIHFVWRGTIHGDAEGTIRCDFDGEARTSFRRNRIGFCVLHPIRECAGARARQTRVDGTVVDCCFPKTIEPQIIGAASFSDLSRVAHEVQPGLWAEVRFKGDVFEMEDQRNWTDASFKTYCTPLALPFPVEIPAGTRIQQSVTLSLKRSDAMEARHIDEMAVEVSSSARSAGFCAVRVPSIGVAISSHGWRLSASAVELLRTLRPAHLRADISLAATHWPDDLARAAGEAQALGCGLELVLHLAEAAEAQLGAMCRQLGELGVAMKRVIVFRDGEAATSHESLRHVRDSLGELAVPIGGGSDANFCELNREQALGRFGLDEADFVCWSMNPQVHVFDHLSMMETLATHSGLAKTARTFAGSRPLIASPVTLRPRFNAVAASAQTEAQARALPPQVDPRQLSLFAAAWTVGSIAALSSAGIESATFFETTGWLGVMETPEGPANPDAFPSVTGGAFPLFHALADIAEFSATEARALRSDENRPIAAMIMQSGAGGRLLLANLSDANIDYELDDRPAVWNSIRRLNADTAPVAMAEPDRFRATKGPLPFGFPRLILAPYEMITLE